MTYHFTIKNIRYTFENLKVLLAKSSPFRSADSLAGLCAVSEIERAAAQCALADVPLKKILKEELIPYEEDEVTRLIIDTHDEKSFQPISHFTVGEFRNWLLLESTRSDEISCISKGITPEMAAAVSKIMPIQDLIAVAKKCNVVTQFRNTIGLTGRFSTRLQPNHPTDDLRGILASTLDGLLLGSGDAVIGINPAMDSPAKIAEILTMLDSLRRQYEIPTQTCVLTHITTTIQLIEKGAPVDIVFQSIAGSEKANSVFGVNLNILKEAKTAAEELKRGTIGNNLMYFETGQGSALSSDTHHNIDAQTIEARAYAIARAFNPLLVNTVVGFIGPEYLFNGKQIIRAGLEDHFCGKLLGLPMGCDVCYTNHEDADQDDMDTLLTLLSAAGCSYFMGVPGADDIMLNYQSTSFHDALYLRSLFNLRPAPEFESWLIKMQIWDEKTNNILPKTKQNLLQNFQI